MGSVLETGNLEQARVCLENFKYSRNVAEEAREVALICAKFIKLDDAGDTDEYCYQIYKENPKAMQAAWKKLPTKADRDRVQKSYRQVGELYKSGNG